MHGCIEFLLQLNIHKLKDQLPLSRPLHYRNGLLACRAQLTSRVASGVGKWVPVSAAGKAKAGVVHSVSGWTRGVQVKLWDPLRTCAIPERLRGVFTTWRYTNTRLPYLTLRYLTVRREDSVPFSLHPCLRSTEAEAEHLRRVTETFINELLPSSFTADSFVRNLLREIFTCKGNNRMLFRLLESLELAQLAVYSS